MLKGKNLHLQNAIYGGSPGSIWRPVSVWLSLSVCLFFVSIRAPLVPNGDIRVFYLDAICHSVLTFSFLFLTFPTCWSFLCISFLYLLSFFVLRPRGHLRHLPQCPVPIISPTACHRQSVCLSRFLEQPPPPPPSYPCLSSSPPLSPVAFLSSFMGHKLLLSEVLRPFEGIYPLSFALIWVGARTFCPGAGVMCSKM